MSSALGVSTTNSPVSATFSSTLLPSAIPPNIQSLKDLKAIYLRLQHLISRAPGGPLSQPFSCADPRQPVLALLLWLLRASRPYELRSNQILFFEALQREEADFRAEAERWNQFLMTYRRGGGLVNPMHPAIAAVGSVAALADAVETIMAELNVRLVRFAEVVLASGCIDAVRMVREMGKLEGTRGKMRKIGRVMDLWMVCVGRFEFEKILAGGEVVEALGGWEEVLREGEGAEGEDDD